MLRLGNPTFIILINIFIAITGQKQFIVIKLLSSNAHTWSYGISVYHLCMYDLFKISISVGKNVT
jgi:hypothetical protein